MKRLCFIYFPYNKMPLLLALITLSATPSWAQLTLPKLPQVLVDTSDTAPTGGTLFQVKTSCGTTANCFTGPQGAFNTAKPGDIIEIEAGSSFVGNFTFPNKTGNQWIYVRTSAWQSLPPRGQRVGPQHAHLMPKLISQNLNVAALNTDYSAHHVRFIGIEFTSNKDDNQIIMLGAHWPNYETSLSQLAHHITFDRVYIHGNPQFRTKAGITMKGQHVAIIDSYISEIHHDGQDSAAIFGFNTPGPLKIVNNYVEGAGENIIFGGADPRIQNLVPSDMEIRGNHIAKPLSWKNPIPSGPHAGNKWSVKNLFELKNARRVLVEGNILEHNWAASQRGVAIQLTPRNQNNSAPQSTVEDVTFRNNIVRDSKHFLNILSSDTQTGSSQTTSRILFENNLVYDIDEILMEFSTGVGYPPTISPTIRHNTILHRVSGNSFLMVSENLPSVDGLIFNDNILTRGNYGFHFSSGVTNDWLINYEFRRNVIVGTSTANATHTPPTNCNPDPFSFCRPAGVSAVGFVNIGGGDYHLAQSSPYKNKGTDGKDIGADINAVLSATTCAVSGVCVLDTVAPAAPSELRVQ